MAAILFRPQCVNMLWSSFLAVAIVFELLYTRDVVSIFSYIYIHMNHNEYKDLAYIYIEGDIFTKFTSTPTSFLKQGGAFILQSIFSKILARHLIARPWAADIARQ